MAISEKDIQRFVLIAFIVGLAILAILYAIGLFLSTPCYSIGSCRECWDALNETAKNNAYVNITICACAKAAATDFADRDVNSAIEDRYYLLTGSREQAKSICDGNHPFIFYE